MNAKNLTKLADTLKTLKTETPYNYVVPDLWNCFDYPKDAMIQTRSGELMVNPYDFYRYLVDEVFIKKTRKGFDPHIAISQNNKRRDRGDWVKKSFMYSTMIRTSSAWDHDRSGELEINNLYNLKETGTFIKMLALLPLLKKMDIDTLYLLPISKHSTKIKKGDFGSPYAVTNFTELDPNLKDPITEDKMTIDEEFAALVEACHLLDIRVVIDIIPRTNAIDNDLIAKHPDWFYWVKADEAYETPRVAGIEDGTYPELEPLEVAFKDKMIQKHLSLFDEDPMTKDLALWNKVKRSKNILEAVKNHYNLTIAPAFSDYINDLQPPWTDVTFFRLYLDHPKATRGFLKNPDKQAPYILYDTIKSNLYPGDKPNMPLWETLANIIPTYQKRFGIDGARIDMGHALPKPLLDMIIKKAKAIDPDFAFIAEELNPKYADIAESFGYNMIIGNGFMMSPRVFTGHAKEYYQESIKLPIPTFACSETHDTPRIASRFGKERLATTLTVLNMFMPNGVPFLNAGQEVYEVQPMNLGLDATEADRYHLPEDDPYYNKLALFDKVALHYMHERRWNIPDILEHVSKIRKRYLTQMHNPKHVIALETDNPAFIGYGFYKTSKKQKGNMLIVLANLNPDHDYSWHLDIGKLRHKANNTAMEGKLLFSTHEFPRAFTQFVNNHVLDIHLGPGEVKIIEI